MALITVQRRWTQDVWDEPGFGLEQSLKSGLADG